MAARTSRLSEDLLVHPYRSRRAQPSAATPARSATPRRLAIRATVVPGFFEVLLLGQHLGLKRLPTGGRPRSSIPSLLGTDQPQGRILREPLGLATYNPFAGSGVGYALKLARPSTRCSDRKSGV